MTDTWDMTGRIAHERATRRQAAVLASAIVLTLGGGVWTAIVRVDHGSGPDTVTAARATTLTTAVGSRLAVRGDHLAVGDVLVTGADGRASVDVPDGRLELGPSTAVRVVGPRLAELLHGTAGLQLKHRGAALSLQTGTVTASVAASGAAVRVLRDYRVSAAALAGTTSLSGVDGSQLDVPGLSEADVSGLTVPATAIPVQELDHAADGVDAALAPHLVQADIALDRLAAQVDADSVARAALHPASYESSQLAAAATHPSEIALTRAIGQVSTSDPDAGARALELRAAGAAWGVIAAELHVTADQLRPIIDQMLAAPTLRALVPVVAAQAAGPTGAPSGSAGLPGGSVGSTPATSVGTGPTSTEPQPVSSGPTRAAPPSSPPASSAPTGPFGDVVGTVTGAIGLTPSPSPSPSPSPPASPSPTPSPGLGSLLCPLIGLLGLC